MFTPAKTNLFLRVIGRRPDGFHELENVFLPLWSLGDEVELLPATEAGPIGLEVVGAPELPDDSDNLCLRAAKAFEEATGQHPRVNIRLTKRIPVSAGLGGGSSDAAAVLCLLNQHCRRPLTDEALRGLAAQLGSDVSFFLKPQAALGTGRGEILTPIALKPTFSLLLAAPLFPVPVAWAFEHLMPAAETVPSLEEFLAAAQGDDIHELARCLRNDLEAAVFAKFPLLCLMRRVLLKAGALAVHVSGSGPTLFAICASDEAAGIAAEYDRAFGTYLPKAAVCSF